MSYRFQIDLLDLLWKNVNIIVFKMNSDDYGKNIHWSGPDHRPKTGIGLNVIDA